MPRPARRLRYVFYSMKRVSEIFSTLGRRLDGFGSDAATRSCIDRAIEANGWFTQRDILRAVDAVRSEMLDPGKLDAWLSGYTPVAVPRDVAVIMAGNIPLVGFNDLLCVAASGNVCCVKPSGKDTVLMEMIIDMLREIEPQIAIRPFDDAASYDAVIATGGDDANRYFRTRFAGTESLLRGSRHSVAVLSGNESTEDLAALIDDITSYSGLGCRNVSMILLPQGYDPDLYTDRPINVKLRRNLVATAAMLTMQRRPFTDCGAFLCVESTTFPSALSCVALHRYDDTAQVEKWLSDNDAHIQCVVTDRLEHPRRAAFGRAQYPALTDYADGCDTMSFLTAL